MDRGGEFVGVWGGDDVGFVISFGDHSSFFRLFGLCGFLFFSFPKSVPISQPQIP